VTQDADIDARTWDLTVVGAGILGLACARELSRRHPDWRILVVDKEPAPGTHQTGHNSGVIHAGIYYPPGSLKAALCVRGARLLYEFCSERSVPVRRCGKLIVAADMSELPRLEDLHERGRRNGVPGLRRLAPEEARELEPHVAAVAALHSPATGVVNFKAVAAELARELTEAGHRVELGTEVRDVQPRGRELELTLGGRVVRTRFALFCAGAWADKLAERAGASAEPRIVPFRGAYLELHADRSHLVKSLIYPVPDPRLPFLGVHLTRHIDGTVSIGPTALPAAARDAYRATRLSPEDLARTLSWPGTRRMAWRFRRAAATELRHAVSRRALVRAAARFVPELRPGDVRPAGAGVRAQAVARDGTLVDDFAFSHTHRAVHVRNAPSPAATASLAIAEHIAGVVDERQGEI
jgi:(S)-2-hydroxyglutarate dehydrogenase